MIVWSLALWLVNALALFVTFAAFDIPVGFGGALVLQGVLVIGISVQLTPGFVGQFEAAIVAALALYGIPNDVASSYAIAYHGATFLPITLAGAWSLARTPVALSDLRGRPGAVTDAAVQLPAHAKLNLFLRVLAREADGYHGLETLFCLVRPGRRAAGGAARGARGHDRGRSGGEWVPPPTTSRFARRPRCLRRPETASPCTSARPSGFRCARVWAAARATRRPRCSR